MMQNFQSERTKDGVRLLRYTGDETDIRIPKEVTEIAADAFSLCNAETVTLEKTGTRIVLPTENPYLMIDLMAGFGKNGKLYDFSTYDDSLDSTWLDARRIEMICTRLLYPEDLDADKAEELRGRITRKLDEILKTLASSRNMRVLKLIAECGFFKNDNVDICIARFQQLGEREMMAWLMKWKDRTFGMEEFDFSL